MQIKRQHHKFCSLCFAVWKLGRGLSCGTPTATTEGPGNRRFTQLSGSASLQLRTDACAHSLDGNTGGLQEDCKLKLEYLDPGFAHYTQLEFPSYLLKRTSKDLQLEWQRMAGAQGPASRGCGGKEAALRDKAAPAP